MLTISKALSSAQAQNYHKMEFTSESQRYYKQDGAVEGEWQGRLMGRFGLSGAVNAADFAALADGRHPQSGEELVKRGARQQYTNRDGTTTKSVEHRAGWDATFSAPKSVSLTALVGGDERVREAHRTAVTAALTELERYTQARIGGNHAAETTGKFIVAKFEHDTARPVEGYAAPQLHTHAVIFNVTQLSGERSGSAETGKQFRALQERGFFETQNYATAVYQSALTYQLRKLGYEIETGRSGAPEIKGYSLAYLDTSSPRSQQMREHLERSGHSGPEAAQIAAHATRDSKQLLSSGEVLAAHRELAATFGNQADQVVAEARRRAQAQTQTSEEWSRAKEAVAYARESNFEREAVVDERVLMRDALRRGMGETTHAHVQAEFDARRETGDFPRFTGHKHATGQSFTTPETIANERANVAHMKRGQNAVVSIMHIEQAAAYASSRELLNTAQQRVIAEVLASRDRIHGLQGLAGSGKTSALDAVRYAAEQQGYAVEGFAPTARAAGQLREAGISATTLQSFLARCGQDRSSPDPASRHLYMLDESSLASTRQMRAFLQRIGTHDHVLVIGDIWQHQGVDAGRPFEQMQDAGMRTSQLDQILRQKDPELLKAVERLAQNDTITGVRMLGEQGRITEISHSAKRFQAIARDYAATPANTIIVSPDNRSRQEINQAVRVELRKNGSLALRDWEFATLVHRSDMTGADRGWAARYQPGDVVQYNKGSKAQGIERGSFATVLSANARENTVTVARQDGQTITYDPRRLKGVNVYQVMSREIATGDRLQFTAPDKALGVHNRELGTVMAIAPGSLTVKMDGKQQRVLSFDPAKMRHFDHGYAVTSHSSQGLTAGRVLANIDTEAPRALINSRLAYVAISRASEDARIYTNDAAVLGERLAAKTSKTAAVDFRQPTPKEPVNTMEMPLRFEHFKEQGTAVIEKTSPKQALIVSEKPGLGDLSEKQQSSDPVLPSATQLSKRSPAKQFEEYHAGVQADRYRVTSIRMLSDGEKRGFVLDRKDGVSQGFSAEELVPRIPEMTRLQNKGANLYYTPMSENRHHILVDDLSKTNLERLLADGHKPAMILESSPGNYQAVLTVPKLGTTHDRAVGNRVALLLNREYGDPKLSGAIHPHRAPGFENRKPKHQRTDGTYPEVTLLQSEHRQSNVTLQMSLRIDAEYAQHAQQATIARQSHVAFVSGIPLPKVYKVHRADILARLKGELDYSRIDYMIALRMRATGWEQGAIEETIRHGAPAARPPHSRSEHQWNDYAARTANSVYTPNADRQLAALAPKHDQRWAQLEGRDITKERQQAKVEPNRADGFPAAADLERHYAPLLTALTPEAARQFSWKAQTGSIQTYQHESTLRNIHIDGDTRHFYDQDSNPVTASAAVAHAMPVNFRSENALLPAASHGVPAPAEEQFEHSQGFGL